MEGKPIRYASTPWGKDYHVHCEDWHILDTRLSMAFAGTGSPATVTKAVGEVAGIR